MDERSIKEIIREELGKLSKLTWGQRLVYVWDYYKPLMAALLVIIGLISVGVTIYRNMQLNYLMNAFFINCHSYQFDSDELANEFAELIGGIGEKDVISIDPTMTFLGDNSQYEMANQMKLMAMSAASEIDFVVLDEAKYQELEVQGFFKNLNEVLTADQLEQWSDLLVEGTKKEDGIIPISAIDLTDAALLTEIKAYSDVKVYGAIATTSVRTELCDEFFSYLLGEEVNKVR